MVIQKSLSYLLARGLPGLISLLSIMIYTRLMSPETYGQYAIVISLVILVITMGFQWMQFSILRFYPKQEITENALITNISFAFILVASFIFPLFALVLGLSLDFLSLPLLFIILLLTFSHAFFDITTQLPVSKGEALYYGWLLFLKSSMGLVIAITLLFYGYQLEAPLIGLACSYTILLVFLFKKYFTIISWDDIDKNLIKSMLSYGLPLSGTFLMNYIIANSDRLMLAWMMGEDSAGLYSAGYDLSNFSFIVILLSIHLAIYPMIVKAYENKDEAKTQQLFSQNMLTIVIFSIVPGILFSVLVVDFSQLVFGEEFWLSASKVIPIVAVATFFLGLKAYYFDLVFLLTHKTQYLLKIGLIGASLNIILNYALIKQFGILGAAYATCLSYFFILCLSYWFGRSIIKLPFPISELLKVLFVFFVCVFVLWLLHTFLWNIFFVDLLVLLMVYLSMVYYFNFLNCQTVFKNIFSLLKIKTNEV